MRIPRHSLLVALAALALQLLWQWLARSAAPELIARAYRGDQSVRLLRQWAGGLKQRSLEEYLRQWELYATTITVLLALASVALVVLTLPRFQRWAERRAPLERPSITPRRARVVSSLLILYLLLTAVFTVLGLELWPLSGYPMFADNLHLPRFTTLIAAGHSTRRGEAPLDLRMAMPDINWERESLWMHRAHRVGEDALGKLLERYLRRHDGPVPLCGAGAYELSCPGDRYDPSLRSCSVLLIGSVGCPPPPPLSPAEWQRGSR